MQTKIILALLLFASFSLAVATNCNPQFQDKQETCGNSYYTITQNPALTNGDFGVKDAEICITSQTAGDKEISFGVSDLTRVTSFKLPELVTVKEPVMGWVANEYLFQNVSEFKTLSGDELCEIGQANSQNKDKARISYEFSDKNYTSSIVCYRNAIQDKENYWVYSDYWGKTGTRDVEKTLQVEQTRLTNEKEQDYNWASFNSNFKAGEKKCGLISYQTKPRSGLVNESIFIYVGNAGMEKDGGGGNDFILFDPFVYASYDYEIEFYVNNTAAVNKINELVVLNASAYSQYCKDAGCHDVRLAVLDNSGSWVGFEVFNASRNYTTETDLRSNTILLPTQPVYWVAPAQNQPLYISTIANTSAHNNTLAFKLYVGSTGVTTFPSVTELYGTSFCHNNATGLDGNWTFGQIASGLFSDCAFTVTGIANAINRVYVGQAGGFLTVNVNNSGATTDLVWLQLAYNDLTGASADYYRTDFGISGAGNLYRVTGGAFVALDTGNVTPSSNTTAGFGFYANGTKPLVGYSMNYVPNESSLLTAPTMQALNDSAQQAYHVGFTAYGQDETVRNLCYLYSSADGKDDGLIPTEYCRIFFDFGGSATANGTVSTANVTANLTSLSLTSPTNATLSSPITVTYYANSTNNATFPCNVTLNGTNIYNETHTNATSTNFFHALSNGFYTLNVTCDYIYSQWVSFTITSGLNVSIFDQTNSSVITANLTITNGTTSNYTNASSTFWLSWTNLVTGELTVIAHNNSYYDAQLYTTNDGLSYSNLVFYLLPQSSTAITTRFHIQTSSGTPIYHALVTTKRYIGGAWTTVGQQYTDASGISAFYMQYGTQYQIDVQATGYTSVNTTLQITSSDYTITLGGTGSGGLTWNNSWTNVTYSYIPTYSNIPRNQTTYFNWTWTGYDLAYSGYYIYLSNGTLANSTNSTSASGSFSSWSITNIANNVMNVSVIGYFKRPGFTQQNVTIVYYYQNTGYVAYNATLSGAIDYLKASNAGQAGLGIVAILLTIVISAWAMRYGGASGTSLVTVVILGIFAYTNFISWTVFGLAVIIGAAALYLWRSA